MRQPKINQEPTTINYQPLFTGNYTRDTSVSEYEKMSEVSNAIVKFIKKRFKKRKNAPKKTK